LHAGQNPKVGEPRERFQSDAFDQSAGKEDPALGAASASNEPRLRIPFSCASAQGGHRATEEFLVSDQKVRRWAGSFGVAGFVVFLLALPTYFVPGSVPRLEDAEQFSAYVTRTNTFILIRATLADPLILVGLLVFVAGFRHLIRQARQDYEWIATLVFGAGLVMIALELVGDGLEAGAALDTAVKADPTVIRGLMEGSFPLYGAIGLIMLALSLASAGYAPLVYALRLAYYGIWHLAWGHVRLELLF
jgi:hypothetical protein